MNENWIDVLFPFFLLEYELRDRALSTIVLSTWINSIGLETLWLKHCLLICKLFTFLWLISKLSSLGPIMQDRGDLEKENCRSKLENEIQRVLEHFCPTCSLHLGNLRDKIELVIWATNLIGWPDWFSPSMKSYLTHYQHMNRGVGRSIV